MQPGNVRSKLKAERIQEKLKAERIQSKLGVARLGELFAELPGWWVGDDGRSLLRVYELPTLRAAGHVPDVDLRHLEVTLKVAGSGNEGIAETDFELARMLDCRL
jgi:pterin-4a-carbinolamine dehydratase